MLNVSKGTVIIIKLSVFSLYRSLISQKYENDTVHDMYLNGASFYSLHDIYHEIDMLAKKYSSMIKKIVIGSSIEKREIIVVKLSTGQRKSSIFMLAGEQGREWLTTTIIMEIIELVIKNHKIMQLLLNYYDFHLLPVLNPDGYEYAFKEVKVSTNN